MNLSLRFNSNKMAVVIELGIVSFSYLHLFFPFLETFRADVYAFLPYHSEISYVCVFFRWQLRVHMNITCLNGKSTIVYPI
jgi:hypothetical protein